MVLFKFFSIKEEAHFLQGKSLWFLCFICITLSSDNKKKKKEKVYTKDVIDIKSAEEVLGPEAIKQIAEKEWKTAELPDADKLASTKPTNPKARNNINSRKNLMQYRKDKPKEAKEKVVKALKTRKKRERVNPFTYIKLPAGYDKDKIIAFLPDRRVLKSADEERIFYTLLGSYFNDFELLDLTSSDIEDVVSLAINRILENRLLEVSANDPGTLMDVSTTVEKFRKHSEKVKASLAARRSDRVDPRNKQSFSIVDIVQMYDDAKKQEFADRVKSLEKEIKDFEEKKKLDRKNNK